MKYFAEGKLIPERVNSLMPQHPFRMTTLDNKQFDCLVELKSGRIFVHIDAPDDITLPDLKNNISKLVGSLINYVGFKYVISVSYEIDPITAVEKNLTHVFDIRGFVFDDTSEFGDRITFKPAEVGAIELNMDNVVNDAVSRAIFELRSAIRYPDYTALHCRLAVEAIRNYFGNNEKLAWQQLRKTLNVDESTIKLFQEVAGQQRHGKGVPQSWQGRRQAMQIAWEICHRFISWLSRDPSTRLPASEFPKL